MRDLIKEINYFFNFHRCENYKVFLFMKYIEKFFCDEVETKRKEWILKNEKL